MSVSYYLHAYTIPAGLQEVPALMAEKVFDLSAQAMPSLPFQLLGPGEGL